MEGWRARKRGETCLRIAEHGLRLFDQNGYDETTLEAVARAAGVSPRTLFHYFAGKHEILEFWHKRGFEESLRPTILQASAAQTPWCAVQACLLELVPGFETDQLVTVDRIRHSTATLRAEKQVAYTRMEEFVFAALCEKWPQQALVPSLQVVAMIAVGALRLAMERRRQEHGPRSLADHLREIFGTFSEIMASNDTIDVDASGDVRRHL